MLFALHPAEFYYNTAIFNSTLREKRQYICHLTNIPNPLYVLSLMFCMTVDAEGWRTIMPHYIILHSERRCAPFVWMQAFSLAHLPSHWPELTFGPHPDAEITPSAGRQAAGSHISPYIPPLRGCRSDQRNSCKNMAVWRCPRLYLLWELSRDSHH